jgi:hypothetical protein
MNSIFLIIAVIMTGIGIFSFLRGSVWVGGNIYFRKTERMNFYAGVFSYFLFVFLGYFFGTHI